MQVLLFVSNSSPEILWNAIRFGNVLLEEDEEVTIFLNGPAVNLYEGDSGRFPIREQAKIFSLSGGILLA